MGKQHSVTLEIPDGKFCNPEGQECPFWIGEMHPMCFCLPDNPDLEMDGEDNILKSEKCPNKEA